MHFVDMHQARDGVWVRIQGNRQTDSLKILGMDYIPLTSACYLSSLAK